MTSALKALRQPFAWILLAAAGLTAISGLWQLFDPPSSGTQVNWVLYNAYYGTGYFVGFQIAALLLAPMLLVTVIGGRTARARAIVLLAMIGSGVMLFLGLLTLILGAFSNGYQTEAGEDFGGGLSALDKLQNFVNHLPDFALVLLPLLVGVAIIRTAELSASGGTAARQPAPAAPPGPYGTATPFPPAPQGPPQGQPQVPPSYPGYQPPGPPQGQPQGPPQGRPPYGWDQQQGTRDPGAGDGRWV